MSNTAIGFFFGVTFTALVTFMFKENTVLYKEGAASCMKGVENVKPTI